MRHSVPVFPITGLLLFLSCRRDHRVRPDTAARWRPAALMAVAFGGVLLLLFAFIGVSSVEVVRPAQVATRAVWRTRSVPFSALLPRLPMPVTLQPDLGVRVLESRPPGCFLIAIRAVVFALVQACGCPACRLPGGRGRAAFWPSRSSFIGRCRSHVPQAAVLVEHRHPERDAIERNGGPCHSGLRGFERRRGDRRVAAFSSGAPHQIERFESMKENGTRIEALPERVVLARDDGSGGGGGRFGAAGEPGPGRRGGVVDGEAGLAERLRTLHPEVGGWFPSMNEVRSRGGRWSGSGDAAVCGSMWPMR